MLESSDDSSKEESIARGKRKAEDAGQPMPLALRVHPNLVGNLNEFREMLVLSGLASERAPVATTIDSGYYTGATQARMKACKDGVDYLLKVVFADTQMSVPPNLRGELKDQRAAAAQHMREFLNYRYILALQELNSPRIKAMSPALANAAQEAILKQFSLDCIGLIVHGYDKSVDEAVELLERAEQFSLLSHQRSQQVTVLPLPAVDGGYEKDAMIIMVETPQPAISDQTAQEYLDFLKRGQDGRKKPDWVASMSAKEQAMLFYELNGADSVDEVKARLVNVSSKLRIIPALPNAYVHQCYLYRNKQLRLINTEGRSSMVSSRDLYSAKADDKVRRDHAENNMLMNIMHQLPGAAENFIKLHNLDLQDGDTLDDLPILFQTMISPYASQKKDQDLYKYKEEAIKAFNYHYPNGLDVEINKGGQKIKIKVKPKIFSTNHPINYYAMVHGMGGEKEDTQELIRYARMMLPKLPAAVKSEVTQLISHLEDDMKRNWNFGKKTNQSLMLCTHEQLLMQALGGFTFGSCVSGKDRKATEIMHTDAAKIYRIMHQIYPGFHKDSEKQREHFCRIYAELFCSRHHQLLSGENALGSEGIKNIGIYLGSDHEVMVHALFKELLGQEFGEVKSFDTEDRLAGRNELAKLAGTKSGGVQPEALMDVYSQFCMRLCLVNRTDRPEGTPVDILQTLNLYVGYYVRQNSSWVSSAPKVMTDVQGLLKVLEKQVPEKQLDAFQYKVLLEVEQRCRRELSSPHELKPQVRDFALLVLRHCEPLLSDISSRHDLVELHRDMPADLRLESHSQHFCPSLLAAPERQRSPAISLHKKRSFEHVDADSTSESTEEIEGFTVIRSGKI